MLELGPTILTDGAHPHAVGTEDALFSTDYSKYELTAS